MIFFGSIHLVYFLGSTCYKIQKFSFFLKRIVSFLVTLLLLLLLLLLLFCKNISFAYV